MKQHADFTENQLAFKSPALPVNPLPFLTELIHQVRVGGSEFIQTDGAKMLLLTINIMAYGQLATIDLPNEWERLSKIANGTTNNEEEPIKKAITGYEQAHTEAPPIYNIYKDGSVKVINQQHDKDVVVYIPYEDMELILKALKK